MRTFLIVLALVLLIGGGYYLKNHDFSSKKNSEPEVTKAVFVKLQPSIKQWNAILPGKWNVEMIDSGDQYKWKTNLEIIFLADHTYKLKGKESILQTNDYLLQVIGGGAEGNWVLSDSTIGLPFRDSKFIETRVENYHPKKYLHLIEQKDSVSLRFGRFEDLTLYSNIDSMSVDNIFISAKDFGRNLESHYHLTKMEK